MRRRTALLTVGAVAAATAATVVIAYGGETPSATGGADCDRGVWVTATGYSGDEQNSLSINFDGHVQQEEFESDDALAMPIPHDTQQHVWVWSVGSTGADYASKRGVITCDKDGNAIKARPTATTSPEPEPTSTASSMTAPPPTDTGKPSPTATTTSAAPEPSASSTPAQTPTPKDTPSPSPSSSPTPTAEPTPSASPTPTPTASTTSATPTTSPSAD